MADTEILNVLLKLENPQVFDRIEKLKSEQFQIKFSGSLDQGIKDILALQDKKISIVADVQGAINSLKQVETSLKSLQGLQEIKINLSGNVEKDLDRIGKKALELQAKLYAAELNQLGLVQNYNPKTFSGGDKEIRQAQVLRGINEQTVAANTRPPITQQQLDAARTNQPVRELVNEITAPYNPGQIRRTQQSGSLPDEQAVKRAIQARQEDILRAAEKQVIADFNGLADNLIKDISKPASGASSAVGGETSEKIRLAKLAEDAALEKQGKESAAAREIANRELNERRIKQNFLNETVGPQGVRVPLSQVGALTKAESQKEFERAEELANAQIREQSLAKLRANAQGDFNSFFNEVQPGVRSLNKKFDTKQLANEEKRVAQLRELGQSAALGALQGQGALSVGGSLLGSLVGSAAPGGAAFGGLVGGALGASAERTIESITRALEKAAEAGLSFETSILGISSVLQATTRVSGPGGEALGLGEQLSFQQGQARSIQKLARTKLLPLGISGDKESTLVQSIISGAAQRGIQLTPEQAATLAERLGGAIQSQRPELLGNSGQLRRDVEDLFSGAPQNTVLKTLTKGFAPGLGKATSAEDLIKRSEGLASFPETLRSSTTNPVVAAQKLNSAVANLNTTVGDALVTALIPGVNALAKELANPQLLDGVEKMASAIGGVTSFFVTASAGLIGLTTDAVRLVTSIPGAAGDLAGVGIRRAIGRGSSAENNLLELQAKKKGGFFTDEREINAQIAAAQKKFDQENVKNKVTPKASVELAKALRGSGIDDLNTSASPDLKSGAAILVSLEEAKKQIQNEFKEALEEAKANNKNPLNAFNQVDIDARRKDLNSNRITQELGLSLEKVSALRKDSADRQSLFDTSSPLGQVNKLTDGLKGLSAVREELEETVRLAKFKQSELGKDALPEDVKKANEVVRFSTQELIKARNEEREAIDKLKTAELDRAKVLRDSQFDPGTIQGRSGLIQSGLQDANGRIGKASAELAELRERLANATDSTDKKNIQSRIEKATLEFNQGQIGRAELSRQAQNNAIDLAQGPEEAKKALSDFARATKAAADKFDALGDQLVKAKLDLSDFDASQRLRSLGRDGAIIDAAERAVAAGGGADNINSLSADIRIPIGLQSLVKGSRGFDPDARARFEIERANENFDEVSRINGGDRGILDDQQRRAELERRVKQNKRDLEAAPFEDKQRQFAGLRQLVGLQQQGVDIGSEGKDFIKKQAKELGVNLPKLEKAETLSTSLPENVSSINDSVKQIVQLMGGTTGSTTGGALGAVTGGALGAGNLTTSGGTSSGIDGKSKQKELTKFLLEQGIKIQDLEQPTIKEVGGKNPRGYTNGKDYRDVRGLFNPATDTIDLFDKIRDRTIGDSEKNGTLAHEEGHALDKVLKDVSDSDGFKQAYSKDLESLSDEGRKKLGYYLTKGKNGGNQEDETSARSETFAELVGEIIAPKDRDTSKVVDNLPNARKYVEEILKSKNFGKGVVSGPGMGSLKEMGDRSRARVSGDVKDLFSDAPLFEDGPEELKQITSGINDNPINFSDSLIARPSLPSRAYNPILREGLGEGLGNKADSKTNAVLEDVVGGFLDADIDGLKKKNRAPASGLKNGLFSGGLFGDREEVKSGKGTAESNTADAINANINDNFNKLGDIISKALGGVL